MRWIVTGIVALALGVALMLDLTVEPRPRGGWIYRCQVSQSIGGGTLCAVRRMTEHKGWANDPDISWSPKDGWSGGVTMNVRWFETNRAGVTTWTGNVELVQLYGSGVDREESFVLRRLGDTGAGLSARRSLYISGEFDLDALLAYAGDRNTLIWSHTGKWKDRPVALSGTIDVAPLRPVNAAVPGLERRLDALAPRFTTACPRETGKRKRRPINI